MKDKDQLIKELSDRERFCLVAYIQTNDAHMAYLCSRTKESRATKENLASLVSRWINSDPVQAFVSIERERKFLSLSEQVANTDVRSKEDVAKELNILASQENAPKRKSDILMKIAELEGMKKQEETAKESKITYYAQIKCSECPIKKKFETDRLARENNTNKEK